MGVACPDMIIHSKEISPPKTHQNDLNIPGLFIILYTSRYI